MAARCPRPAEKSLPEKNILGALLAHGRGLPANTSRSYFLAKRSKLMAPSASPNWAWNMSGKEMEESSAHLALQKRGSGSADSCSDLPLAKLLVLSVGLTINSTSGMGSPRCSARSAASLISQNDERMRLRSMLSCQLIWLSRPCTSDTRATCLRTQNKWLSIFKVMGIVVFDDDDKV